MAFLGCLSVSFPWCLIWLLYVLYVLMPISFRGFQWGALKTLIVDVPWMAELFGLNVSFELALLPFDVDHILRLVFLCSFSCGIPYAFVFCFCLFFMWWFTVSRFPMKPRLKVNGWPSLDVWLLRSRGVWLFDLISLCSLRFDAILLLRCSV